MPFLLNWDNRNIFTAEKTVSMFFSTSNISKIIVVKTKTNTKVNLSYIKLLFIHLCTSLVDKSMRICGFERGLECEKDLLFPLWRGAYITSCHSIKPHVNSLSSDGATICVSTGAATDILCCPILHLVSIKLSFRPAFWCTQILSHSGIKPSTKPIRGKYSTYWSHYRSTPRRTKIRYWY